MPTEQRQQTNDLSYKASSVGGLPRQGQPHLHCMSTFDCTNEDMLDSNEHKTCLRKA